MLAAVGTATITILDPSDYADLAADAADNNLTADWNYAPLSYQAYAITGPYVYNDTSKEISHKTLTVSKGDTSVVVITENATVNLTQSTVIKHGYSTDLYQSSFYGLNAAVNVANASVAYIDNVNVTVHNGAANIYVYGNNSYAYVSDSTCTALARCLMGYTLLATGLWWVGIFAIIRVHTDRLRLLVTALRGTSISMTLLPTRQA